IGMIGEPDIRRRPVSGADSFDDPRRFRFALVPDNPEATLIRPLLVGDEVRGDLDLEAGLSQRRRHQPRNLAVAGGDRVAGRLHRGVEGDPSGHVPALDRWKSRPIYATASAP